LPELYRFRHRVRDALMRAGLREVWLFPVASDADRALAGDTEPIRWTTPLQSDDRWLRTRLTPGLLKAIRRNAYRQVRGTAMFSGSTVFGMVAREPEEQRA